MVNVGQIGKIWKETFVIPFISSSVTCLEERGNTKSLCWIVDVPAEI
jgi:hypothetical protein